MALAPIVLFVYKRLNQTRRTIESLLKNDLAGESKLYIFSDQARMEADARQVQDVREYIKNIQGFAEINIVEREVNWGLADSIKDGVSKVLAEYEKIIVVEDDIVTSKVFLKFMNDALDKYENDDRIMEISGYNYPIRNDGLQETYFAGMAACWGWGTWRRAWEKVNWDAQYLIERIKKIGKSKFKVSNRFHYWTQLVNNRNGYLHTWFIFWYATIYVNRGLVLYPKQSFVNNIGFDGSGENSNANSCYSHARLNEKQVEYFEVKLEKNLLAHRYYKEFFDTNSPSLLRSFLVRLKNSIIRAK